MILEGLVTTHNDDDSVNLSPMGAVVTPDVSSIILKPFPGSRTFDNLLRNRCCVFHVTDDVLLLAKAAIGRVTNPASKPAQALRGSVLSNTCRWFELEITEVDDRDERLVMQTAIVHYAEGRPFFGLNRAKHAVVEAAILATRLQFIPVQDVLYELEKLVPLVEKTGGDDEADAFEMLTQYVRAYQPITEQSST